MTSNDIQYMWSIVKIARKSFIKNKPSSLYCWEFGFLRSTDLNEIMKLLEEMVTIEASLETYDNITEKVLETAGEMLFYLGSCPGTA